MKIKIILFFFIIILIILVIITGCSKTGEYNTFAKCLTEKGVTMYGTEWCSHCKNQKEMFGNSFQYVDYVDCDWDKDKCLRVGIRGYPTWIIEGEKYSGEQRLERLATLSGCELVKEAV